jgi:four helix bundle protein
MGDFQQLSVWQRAHALALEIHRSTGAFPGSERYGLAAQMRRAAVSVVSNIAEGCGRQNDRELAYFLRIARGSVRELQCQLLLARDLGYVPPVSWEKLDASVKCTSKMLSGFIRTVRRKAPSSQLPAHSGHPIDLFLRRRNSSEGRVEGVRVPAMA